MKDLMSRKKAADYIGMSYSTLKRYERMGLIKPIVNTANNWKYYVQETLDKFISENFKGFKRKNKKED